MNRVRFILNEAPNPQQKTGVYNNSTQKEINQRKNAEINKEVSKLSQQLDADKTRDYQDRYGQASSLEDRDKVCKEYVEDRYGKDKESWKIIKPFEDVVVAELTEKGPNANNPFIQFIDRAIVKNKLPITKDQYSILHNLEVDGKLEAEDLNGMGENGMSDIIFNKSLYDVKDLDDFTFLIQAYHWFRPENEGLITSARPKIRTDVIGDKAISIKDDYNDLKNPTDIMRLRNDILFKDMGLKGNTSGKQLRSAKEVEYDMQSLNAQTRRNLRDREKTQWDNTQERTPNNTQYQRDNSDKKNNATWDKLTSPDEMKKLFNKPNLTDNERVRLLKDLVHYLNDKGIR